MFRSENKRKLTKSSKSGSDKTSKIVLKSPERSSSRTKITWFLFCIPPNLHLCTTHAPPLQCLCTTLLLCTSAPLHPCTSMHNHATPCNCTTSAVCSYICTCTCTCSCSCSCTCTSCTTISALHHLCSAPVLGAGAEVQRWCRGAGAEVQRWCRCRW